MKQQKSIKNIKYEPTWGTDARKIPLQSHLPDIGPRSSPSLRGRTPRTNRFPVDFTLSGAVGARKFPLHQETNKYLHKYIYIYIYISQCLQCLAMAVELWCWSIHFLAKSLIHHLESHGPKPPIRLGGPPAGLMISDGWPNRTPMPPGLRTRELRHSVKTHQKRGVNPVIQTPVREIWVNIVEE